MDEKQGGRVFEFLGLRFGSHFMPNFGTKPWIVSVTENERRVIFCFLSCCFLLILFLCHNIIISQQRTFSHVNLIHHLPLKAIYHVWADEKVRH
jgi:hypothetical protein